MLCHIDELALFCAHTCCSKGEAYEDLHGLGTLKRKLTGGVTTARPYSLLGRCEPWCSEPCSELKGDDLAKECSACDPTGSGCHPGAPGYHTLQLAPVRSVS